jgi:hypothetical protein
MKISKKVALAGTVITAAAVIAGGGAYAATTAATAAAPKPGNYTIYACITGSNRTLTGVYTSASAFKSCPKGSTAIAFNSTGPKGATGPKGSTGPKGATGAPGTSAIQTVSAQSEVTNWKETGGWATANFTRAVTVTSQGAAPAADCGATASSCWFFTATLADNGTFTTVSGAPSPNGSSKATISGVNTGSVVGGGKLEFYASSDGPNPGLVPGNVNGSNPPSATSSWYKLFFPAGTLFGMAPAQVVGYAPWVSYLWTYNLASTCEKWTDGINPGDDGQGAPDGNITGVSACVG